MDDAVEIALIKKLIRRLFFATIHFDISVRYGKQWGGYAEVGFGYRGLLSFGGFFTF